MRRTFVGQWITNREFFEREPRNVFHRQLEPIDLPLDKLQNKHILFYNKITNLFHILVVHN